MIELALIRIIQSVLELGLVQPRADRDVLRRLHVKGDPLDLGEIGSQPIHHLLDRFALAVGLGQV